VNNIPLVSAKRSLDGAIRAFIETHPEKGPSSLGIDKDQLSEVVANDTPTTFWLLQVGTDCPLRNVALRVLCTKLSSIAVERLWSVFGDNLTAQKWSIGNQNLNHVICEDECSFGAQYFVALTCAQDSRVCEARTFSKEELADNAMQFPEALNDMIEFAEHADEEHEASMLQAKLLAGPGQPVDLCQDEASDEDLDDVDDGAGW
jgi:hypothetical protein